MHDATENVINAIHLTTKGTGIFATTEGSRLTHCDVVALNISVNFKIQKHKHKTRCSNLSRHGAVVQAGNPLKMGGFRKMKVFKGATDLSNPYPLK